MHRQLSEAIALITASAMSLGSLCAAPVQTDAKQFETTTPIKHVVVIFQENVSFDHYFATYPYAVNKSGEIAFKGAANTPRANTLLSGGLLTQNPNSVQPFRLSPAEAVTCDQDHDYGHEQVAFDHGLMDKFVETVGTGGPGCYDAGKGAGVVMGYYDGNTTTALWNYAQRFAMSDNSFSTTFGPSTPGAINLISGNTYGATLVPKTFKGTPGNPSGNVSDAAASGSVIGDPRPYYDECVATNPKLVGSTLITMTGKNVGDLLNARNASWGWFQGGFRKTGQDGWGRPVCGAHHVGLAGDDAVQTAGDYIPHHEPFQYYQQSANPTHAGPSSVDMIGQTDRANHQYDLGDFYASLNNGTLPAVSFLKAAAYQDGHAGYSDPIDEQAFLVKTINALMQTNYWSNTAVIIAYDDSDGFYDHQMGPIVMQSDVSDDQLAGPGSCGVVKTADGVTQNGRCGYGPRLPLLVISAFARQNYIDHRVTDQSSILRFIEDNWKLGRIGNGSSDGIAGTLDGMFDFASPNYQPLFLSPATGTLLDQSVAIRPAQ
jgi:phospholipase C